MGLSISASCTPVTAQAGAAWRRAGSDRPGLRVDVMRERHAVSRVPL